LLERAQKDLKNAKMRSLNVITVPEEDVNGITRRLVVIGSRGRNQIKGVYGQTNLPVLAKEHKLSQLYAQAAHNLAHEGVISTLHRTRKRVWIIHGLHKGQVHRMQTEREEVHGAEDGAPP
jgi:hypothetical protein